MSIAPLPILLLLGVGAIVTTGLAVLFLRDPQQGMVEAGHRPEKLPMVMVDRYLGLTVLQAGLIFYGSLEMVAVFCIAGMVMAFGDSLIYARAGLPHIRHTLTGSLAAVGLIAALYNLQVGAGG